MQSDSDTDIRSKIGNGSWSNASSIDNRLAGLNTTVGTANSNITALNTTTTDIKNNITASWPFVNSNRQNKTVRDEFNLIESDIININNKVAASGKASGTDEYYENLLS